MRLIDADAMRDDWLENGENEHVYDTNAVLESIDSQPTIEAAPVVHGRWIASGCGFDCCSECRKVYADGYLTAMGIKPRTQFNYCPNCGAKMDGEAK